MEELAGALAALVGASPAPPLTPETLVVSSKGMERWLSLRLADALGVWSNASYPFPRAFIDSVLARVLGDEPGDPTRFARDSLRWAVLAALAELSSRPELGEVESYLADDARGDKRMELSERIAYAFDQYAVYRPELVLEWEEGGGEGFQPLLWRAIVARLGSVHVAARARRFHERWEELADLPADFPRRVGIFGVSALPPIYVKILAALAERVDVHLFLLCPSDARWQAIAQERPLLRRALREAGTPGALAVPLAALEPPGLLGALGRVEGELQQVLEALVDYVDVRVGTLREPDDASLLGAIQADIFAGRAPGSGPARSLAPGDHSLTVHSCHGPMREVEVLRDRLLGMFHDDPTLEPHDVIVMMPDVEAHAPFINAVFGVDPDASGYIPYRIADRSRRATSPVAEATLALFSLAFGRMAASDVLDLLQLSPVRARFGFDVEDSARVERWVRATGIRWGIDGAHRSELGLPAQAQNTWRFGLDRLLLGFALPGEDRLLFAGTLPYDDIEGQSALVAGRLAELVESLARWRERLEAPRPLAQWRTSVTELIADFVQVSDADAWQVRAVQATLDAIAESAERVGYNEPLGAKLFLRLLGQGLEAERSSHDFLSGGVTFCELLPMRSVPFRVVCLLGMNDGDFPRSSRSPAFDEIARSPRVADRRIRDEDRYSFLEAIQSAREQLLISFVGRGIQDDGVRPPSVVLSELLDAVDSTFSRTPLAPKGQLELFGAPPGRVPHDEPASSAVVLSHPLQPWSERYFGADPDPRMLSFARTELEAAKARAAGPAVRAAFIAEPLAPALEHEVALDDLARFFTNPTRFMLERRLGLSLVERAEVPEDWEPMELDFLERHGIGSFIFARFLEGLDYDAAYAVVRAAGLLPHGQPGEVAFERIAHEARSLTETTLVWRRGGRIEPLGVDVALEDCALVGTLRNVWPAAQVEHTYSRSKAKTELALWIRHLALQLAAPAGHPRQSVFVARSRHGHGIELRRFPLLDSAEARSRLEELVALYRLGQVEPLCFFPDSALEYVEILAEEGLDEDARHKALNRAVKRFVPTSEHAFAEGSDPFIRHVFGDAVPLADGFRLFPASRAPDFQALARSVFGPLVAQVVTEVLA